MIPEIMRRFTVIGTDTGVGKTFVTAALVRAARRVGIPAFGLKPIETGVNDAAQSDAGLLAAASNRSLSATVLQQHPLPMAPGQIPELHVELRELVAFVDHQCAGANPVKSDEKGRLDHVCFVETVGGWFSPITPQRDVRELACALAAPTILVCHAGLGAINQLRLTTAAVQAAQLPIATLILSRRPEDDPNLAERNRQAVEKRTGILTMTLSSDRDADRIVQTALATQIR